MPGRIDPVASISVQPDASVPATDLRPIRTTGSKSHRSNRPEPVPGPRVDRRGLAVKKRDIHPAKQSAPSPKKIAPIYADGGNGANRRMNFGASRTDPWTEPWTEPRIDQSDQSRTITRPCLVMIALTLWSQHGQV